MSILKRRAHVKIEEMEDIASGRLLTKLALTPKARVDLLREMLLRQYIWIKDCDG
jgi:hypothetical protein